MEVRFPSGLQLTVSRGSWYWEAPATNLTTGNSSCNVLLEESDVKDGNIPLILGVSFAAWLVCVVIFLVIRCCAKDYSRAGLTTSSQWLTAVYNRKRDSVASDEDAVQSRRSKTASTLLFEDDHWYTWMANLFWRLRVSDVAQRCGPDASIYLSMELYIVVLLCVFSLTSVCIILPINYVSGSLVSGGFPKTTVSNIPPGSGVLWVHTIFSIIYLCVTVAFMIHFSLKLGKFQQEISNHTVMVEWIPRFVHREDIMQHLQEALSRSPVADIQFAYNVSRLTRLSNELKSVTECLDGVDSVLSELGTRDAVRPGWRKPFCCLPEVDAKTYYEEQYSDLKASIEREKLMIRENKRLGIAFLTFKRAPDATEFNTLYKLCRRKPQSSMYRNVKAHQWWVSMAPFSLDILWENLSVHYLLWWVRWLAINLVLFVFLFFFTTPSIILASIDEIRVRFVNATHVPDLLTSNFTSNPFIKSYLPPLILLFFASLLPLVVSRSSFLEAHWTRSFREQTIMRKTYIFLLLMVILLPSIGLTSLNALGELALKGQEALKSRLGCIYLPNNGAFFVGYVITSTFVGTALELLRLPELALYLYHLAGARTKVLKEQALQKAAQYDFMYGVQYAWNLVIFNMVLSFSLTTPIIVPFGVIYFVMKYFTDKYNIYYVYKPAPFNGRQFLHRSAVNFVILGALHLQLATMFFSIVRLGRVNSRAVVTIVVFSLFALMCIGVMSFGWFKHLLPQLRLKMGREYQVFGLMSRTGSISQDDEESIEAVVKGSYIAPLLKDVPAETFHDGSNSGYGYQSFGSTDCMGRRSPSTSPTSPPPPSSQPPSAKTPTIPEVGEV